MKMYMVGGCVRDEFLGVPSKDIDFTVVLDESDMPIFGPNDSFGVMVYRLKEMGFRIFLESPEFLTVRAQFPKGSMVWHSAVKLLTADFVLARKESNYTDGRRPDRVEPGTLEDDLARRDFTMNAIARDTDGTHIDPFNGQQDIADRIIRAVGDPYKRLTEDALRAVRALRFAVTKDFTIDAELLAACNSFEVIDAIENNISDERIQVELSKMLRYDTSKSLDVLAWHFSRDFRDALFAGKVSLDATLKQKGRGR